MKRVLMPFSIVQYTFLIAVAASLLSCCQNNPSNKISQNESAQITIIEHRLKAGDVIKAFKKANLPIDKVVFCTTETDFDNLLGRPNQYIEKVEWIDTRIKGNSQDNHVGGVIEVFESKDALEDRIKRIEEIEKVAGIKNYRFIHKNVLLRLDSILTSEQADNYEMVLSEL